jgi:L-iditol 2-dehydrogenase
MDALEAAGDDRSDSEQPLALGGPVARGAGPVTLPCDYDNRLFRLVVAPGGFPDRNHLRAWSVQGVGAVGMSAAALARKAGAGQVIVIGAPQSRLDLARQMGADGAINIDTSAPEERLAQVMELTGGTGADVVIEAAGSARAFEEGLLLARNGGAYVIAGHYTNVGDSTVNAHEHINRKHLDIRGCWGSEVGHFLRALQMLERYHADVPWHLIGAETYGLGQINDALEVAASMAIPKALVDPWRT